MYNKAIKNRSGQKRPPLDALTRAFYSGVVRQNLAVCHRQIENGFLIDELPTFIYSFSRNGIFDEPLSKHHRRLSIKFSDGGSESGSRGSFRLCW